MNEHRARKRFGQHFLQDSSVVTRIVMAVNPQRDDHIVEIGPGLGVLTVALLACVSEMDAVELDRDIIPKLAERCDALHGNGLGRLIIHAADALEFDFAALAGDKRPMRIVGNLPYNISTPLMFHLLESRQYIQDMHFMLQKEVVDRMAAQPGGKDYGRLSVMMQYHCQVDSLFDVPPEAFEPPPKVNSAVVRLLPHINPPIKVNDVTLLEKLVTQAFSQRRKTLRNTLRPMISADQMDSLGINPVRRAETLSLDEFAIITNRVADNTKVSS
jgi:16S rRNA (adenine1518-N6/adenine1519-N6)-dimethyltransferase